MQTLIADLLLLAELEQEQKPETEPVSFSEHVNTAIEDLRILHPDRKISASVDEGILVDSSRQSLEHLTSNLISNLSRYVPDDCEISFKLYETGGLAYLLVDDSGPGLPEEVYAQGVQQFSRFDASRSRQSGGSGLGLSIIAAIVARHDGAMTLSKSPLGGLRTEIQLKVTQNNS
jgi:two-component system OmpR family sensor kinase